MPKAYPHQQDAPPAAAMLATRLVAESLPPFGLLRMLRDPKATVPLGVAEETTLGAVHPPNQKDSFQWEIRFSNKLVCIELIILIESSTKSIKFTINH